MVDITELEKFIGFPINRNEVTIESGVPYDESIAYSLCQVFYGREEALTRAISLTTEILLLNVKQNGSPRQRELLFSVLGNLYYLHEDFEPSIGCFLKALNLNRKDLNNLIELAFALRASGRVSVFEDIIFNLEDISRALRQESRNLELNGKKMIEIIERIKKN